MLLFLYRLFIIGFPKPPTCEHTWDSWEQFRQLENTYGYLKVFQRRTCTKCGFQQISVTTHH